MTTPEQPSTAPPTEPETDLPLPEQTGHSIGIESAPAAPPPGTLTGRQKLWVFGVTLAAALAYLGYQAASGGGSGPSASQVTEARLACEHAVEARLVSPASADFSGVRVAGTGPLIVTGTVDSDNALGASIRNTFRCEVTDGRVTSVSGLTR